MTGPPESHYEKYRMTARVGDQIDVPIGATAITITDFAPFDDTVQVSWLQPRDDPATGVTNVGVLHAERTNYADTDPVTLPTGAWAITVYEPLDSDESIVYWLV